MNINDLTITSVETINAFDIITGAYKFTLDELQKVSIEQSQESTEITGKAGRKLSSLKRNKAVKVSGANGMVSSGLLEMQTGSNFENKVTEVLWADYLTVDSDHSATTSWKAVGTTGAEIESLYIKNANGTLGKLLEQGAEVSEGVFTYTPGTKKLAFHTDVENGTEIIVYYKRKIQADVLNNESDRYSGKCALYIDVLAEDKCSNVYRAQLFIPKADFSGAFSLDMGDSQSVHNFEAEALAGACGAGGTLWKYTIFGVNTEDAA